MNKKTQKGFAHLETLLLLIIVALIAFIGYYVWHSRSQANKTLNDAASLNQGITGSKKNNSSNSTSSKANKTSTTAPQLLNYATSPTSNGIEVSSDADIDKLTGASDSFKQFVKGQFDKNNHNPSPCGNAYGLFVKKIYQDNFALGDEKQCNNTTKLWAKVSAQWQEIGSTQTNFDCSLLDQYKVPSAIVNQCMKNGQVVSNTVQG